MCWGSTGIDCPGQFRSARNTVGLLRRRRSSNPLAVDGFFIRVSRQVNARVEWLAVDIAARLDIAECSDARDAAIRIEVSELGRLDEVGAAGDKAGPVELKNLRFQMTAKQQ